MANESVISCVKQGLLQRDPSSWFMLRVSSRLATLTSGDTYETLFRLAATPYRHFDEYATYLQSSTLSQITIFLALCFMTYLSSLVVYRLYLSPVAQFPGPFLARTTHWYEFYYNYVQTGMYYKKIAEFHEKYGPVVRVTPEEIHVMDSAAYQTLFVTGAVRKTEAYQRFSRGTGFEDMTAISTDHDAHRRLRMPLDKLFARQSILRVEKRVAMRAEKLCARLESYRESGETVNLTNAFSSLTTDIISSIIFEEPSDYLSDPNFNEKWYEILKMGTLSVPLFKHMPWFTSWVGRPFLRYLVAKVTRWTIWDEKARREIMLSRKRPSDEAKTRDETTILDHLVHSPLVEQELGDGGFARLAQLIQQAGAHNVSHTLSTITMYLFHDKTKLTPLLTELDAIWRSYEGQSLTPSWTDLEKAPYLSACIKEGLRMAIGGMNRAPRVFPYDDMEVCGWTIPRGTPVSMTTYWMHNDPAVFPNPSVYDPNRWIDADPEHLKAMRTYFVPFAKGSRNCVGHNLVYMQLFHTLARMFRPGSPTYQLHDTTLRDVVAIHGLLFPLPPLDTNGVRVKVF